MSPLVRVDGERREGPALDLSAVDVDADAVARAVRATDDDGTDPGDGAGLYVDCPSPGPLFEYAGVVRPGMSLRPRTTLAAAASTREDGAAFDRQPERAVAPAPDPDDLRAARKRVADAAAGVERLREEVARHQGRVRVLRERGSDAVADAEADLRGAIERLSEAETERAAAEEALERLRERRREALDARERRLETADRAANRARERRRELVARHREAFADAVGAFGGDPGAPFEAAPVVAALACWRVSETGTPVVLATDRLGGAAAAHERLASPVIRV